jgi:Restriction endonuclease
MKPIFTIHAGEYLVASEIEGKLKELNVWIPSKDTGIDLLVTSQNNSKTASIQVKYSKDFSTTLVKQVFRPNIKAAGWWTLNRKKIQTSNADFWVFILYSLEKKNCDFVIINPKELLQIFDKTSRSNSSIHCYIWVTNHNTVFETRGLSNDDMQMICNNNYASADRDLQKYLNNWKPIILKLT